MSYKYVNTRDRGDVKLNRFGDDMNSVNNLSIYDDIFLGLKSDILLKDISEFTRTVTLRWRHRHD